MFFFHTGTLENFRFHIVPPKVNYYGSTPLHKGKRSHLYAEEIMLAHVRVSMLGINHWQRNESEILNR